MQLLIATHNRGKLHEYRELLEDLPYKLLTLDEAGIREDVEETGTTFEENARLKARSYARASGLLTLADDSGLEVDALGGEPGVHSKRYAGPNATDADRIEFLLNKLRHVPREGRSARFRCVIVIADDRGNEWVSEGKCEGEITFEPRGTFGFGYDPVFLFLERGLTMAELPPEEKNRISHRGQAAQVAKRILRQIIASA